MATYTYIENANANLSNDDLRWYSNMNHGEAIRDVLRVDDDFGGSTSYVVFKKSTDHNQKLAGSCVDWGDGSVIFSSYSRFLKIDKATSKILDDDFDPYGLFHSYKLRCKGGST